MAWHLCPRKFTKLPKTVLSTLRMKDHLSVGYVDDSYQQAAESAHCMHYITDTITFLTITAESSRAHWLIFIVNKRTDT